MQGLFGMFSGNKNFGAGFTEPELAQGRQTMFNQLPTEQQASVIGPDTPAAYQMQQRQAFEQLNNPQQQWMGGASATDPFIRARMPQEAQPAQPAQPARNALDPKSVNYGQDQAQQRRRGGGGGGVSAASAPGLGGGGGGGGGTQYAGGIPVILRSYGEPSAGLLRYIEG
jgi:hypothetical protein